MTREEIREAAKVMKAYADGNKIQYRDGGDWIDISNPVFNWNRFKYRIKLEPKHRPFKNQDECWNEMLKHQPFGWFRSKCNKTLFNIICIDDEGIKFTNTLTKSKETYDRAFSSLEFADGTPFGIKENDK